jgi:hypothetical protein
MAKEPIITAQASTKTSSFSQNEGEGAVVHDNTFMFEKQNYMYMIAGLVLITIGYMLMSGGKSADPNVFNRDEIYSFRRITLAPIVIVAGYIVEIFAIMWIPKKA